MQRILYETHMHTPLCKHAKGDPEEYAAIAEKRGLKGIIVTCHCPLPDRMSPNVRMSVEEFDTYLALVERARKTWEGRVDIRLGIESDYFPGLEPWLQKLHAQNSFHYILGSVHPQTEPYLERFFHNDPAEYQKTYFQHLAESAESGLFDALAHPDIIKNVNPESWNLERIWPFVVKAFDRIAETSVAVELNTSGRNKPVAELNPSREILKLIHERNIPIVLGSDAHVPERVADYYEESLDLLTEIGFEEVHVFLERQCKSILITEARKSLIPKNRECD